MYNVGDKFILNSSNGHKYNLEIVNINYCREPDSIYAVDVVMDDVIKAEDVWFVGDTFLAKCTEGEQE